MCSFINISDIFGIITEWKAALKIDVGDMKKYRICSQQFSKRNYKSESWLCGDACPEQNLEGIIYSVHSIPHKYAILNKYHTCWL